MKTFLCVIAAITIAQISVGQAPPKSPYKNEPYVCKVGNKWLTQKQFDKKYPCTKCVWVVNGKHVTWTQYKKAEAKLIHKGAMYANHVTDSVYYGGKLGL